MIPDGREKKLDEWPERGIVRDVHVWVCRVERVGGIIIKWVPGFEKFSLRGLQKIALEWSLVCVGYNLKRLHKLLNPAKSAENFPLAFV
jgi:hypothetical protein